MKTVRNVLVVVFVPLMLAGCFIWFPEHHGGAKDKSGVSLPALPQVVVARR